jgi:hypothetical protein
MPGLEDKAGAICRSPQHIALAAIVVAVGLWAGGFQPVWVLHGAKPVGSAGGDVAPQHRHEEGALPQPRRFSDSMVLGVGHDHLQPWHLHP